jgi:hypothetical protein
MADVGTEDRQDLRPDNSLRGHLESAFAYHRPAGSDAVDSAAQNIKEHREAIERARKDGTDVRSFKDLRGPDKLRLQARNAYKEVEAKAQIHHRQRSLRRSLSKTVRPTLGTRQRRLSGITFLRKPVCPSFVTLTTT